PDEPKVKKPNFESNSRLTIVKNKANARNNPLTPL
uniref:Uncharacterized protein n=1 Tax=Romanomermis culicivorax TaxID=13658 RepID=A0A915IQK6_ROMCU